MFGFIKIGVFLDFRGEGPRWNWVLMDVCLGFCCVG